MPLVPLRPMQSADILPFTPIRATPQITTTRRDTFWRALNTELERGGLTPATNGEMSASFESGALPINAAAHIAVARIRKEQGGDWRPARVVRRVDWVTHAPEIAKARAILAGDE